MKLLLCLTLYVLIVCSYCDKKKKKDPKDYTDADIHRLDEQWLEEGEIDDGDLPEHLRPSKPVDISKMDPKDPESMLKATKKHKTLMMFATVSGDPTEEETEEITSLWQSMLYNANIEITRFRISANRILVQIADGSYAYEIKDFLVQQDRCEVVTIDGKDYHGKAHKGKEAKKKDTKKSKKDKKAKKPKKDEF